MDNKWWPYTASMNIPCFLLFPETSEHSFIFTPAVIVSISLSHWLAWRDTPPEPPEPAEWHEVPNEVKWMGFQANFVHIYAKLGHDNLLKMVRWMRWHCPPDTGFEIRAEHATSLVTEALHNIESLRVCGEEIFCFFETWRPAWGSNPRSPTVIWSTNKTD